MLFSHGPVRCRLAILGSGAPLSNHYTVEHFRKSMYYLHANPSTIVHEEHHIHQLTHWAVTFPCTGVPGHVSPSRDPFRHDYLSLEQKRFVVRRLAGTSESPSARPVICQHLLGPSLSRSVEFAHRSAGFGEVPCRVEIALRLAGVSA